MRRRLLLASFWILVLATSFAHGAEPRVDVRRVPDLGLEPRAVVDVRGTVHLIYFRGDPKAGDVIHTRSTDGGRTFVKPLEVNSVKQSALILGAVRGPELAVGSDGRAHVVWTGSAGVRTKAGMPLLYARLDDSSDAFEPQRNLLTTPVGLDGGASIAADAKGNVYAVWHAPAEKQQEDEQHRRVFVARSTDDGKTFAPGVSPADLPNTGACACCGLDAFLGSDDTLRVIYRRADQTTHRDMCLLALEPTLEHAAGMKLSDLSANKCVMSTSDAAGGFIAWEGDGEIYVARADAPKTHTSLGSKAKNPKHPRVATLDGRTLVAWTEGTAWNKGGSVAWVLLDETLRPIEGSRDRRDDLPTWGYPAVFATRQAGFVILY